MSSSLAPFHPLSWPFFLLRVAGANPSWNCLIDWQSWTVGRSQGTQRKPTQALGEQTNSTQKGWLVDSGTGPSTVAVRRHANHYTAVPTCTYCTLISYPIQRQLSELSKISEESIPCKLEWQCCLLKITFLYNCSYIFKWNKCNHYLDYVLVPHIFWMKKMLHLALFTSCGLARRRLRRVTGEQSAQLCTTVTTPQIKSWIPSCNKG